MVSIFSLQVYTLTRTHLIVLGEGCLKSDGSVKLDTSEIVQQLTINLIYIQNFEIFKKMAVPSLDKNIFYSFSTILVAISLVQNSMQNFLLILH